MENVMVARVDVTDRQAVYAATKQIESVLGHVQILINNAGIVTGKKILDCPDDLMEKTVQVNGTKVVHAWHLTLDSARSTQFLISGLLKLVCPT